MSNVVSKDIDALFDEHLEHYAHIRQGSYVDPNGLLEIISSHPSFARGHEFAQAFWNNTRPTTLVAIYRSFSHAILGNGEEYWVIGGGDQNNAEITLRADCVDYGSPLRKWSGNLQIGLNYGGRDRFVQLTEPAAKTRWSRFLSRYRNAAEEPFILSGSEYGAEIRFSPGFSKHVTLEIHDERVADLAITLYDAIRQ